MEEEPENMITRTVRVFFIKKEGKIYPFLEVIDKNTMVAASTRLTLKNALNLEKTIAAFITYVLRKKITEHRVVDENDLKALKAMEKTIDSLELAMKNIEQLISYLYRERLYVAPKYNRS